MPLTKIANEQGYLKAGLLGYQKSGKSFTAVLLAIGTRKFFSLKGPIAFYDTESGSGYVAEMVKKETGTDLLGVKARSFKSLMQFCDDCIKEKVSVAIVDSITHPWRELCDSYLVQLNEARKNRNWNPLQKLEFQHWAAIKSIWQPWSDFYLNSPLHIIVCGRAGVIWEMEKNTETNRTELIQAGTKMKTESEFGFEPSLLIEMEREQVPDKEGGFKIVHTATVIGDRFNEMDGKVMVNPDFAFFEPHVKRLKAGAHSVVDVTSHTPTGADEQGQGDFERERKLRTIYCEEIQGLIVTKFPGQSAEDKKAKAQVLQDFFGTRSWTKVESMDSVTLKSCLDHMREMFEPEQVSQTETDGDDDVPMGPVPPGGPMASKSPVEASGGSGEVKTGSPASNEQETALAKAKIGSLRLLMKGAKMVESRIMGMLGELGTIPKGIETLEGVDPEAIDQIIENWATFAKAYKESQK